MSNDLIYSYPRKHPNDMKEFTSEPIRKLINICLKHAWNYVKKDEYWMRDLIEDIDENLDHLKSQLHTEFIEVFENPELLDDCEGIEIKTMIETFFQTFNVQHHTREDFVCDEEEDEREDYPFLELAFKPVTIKYRWPGFVEMIDVKVWLEGEGMVEKEIRDYWELLKVPLPRPRLNDKAKVNAPDEKVDKEAPDVIDDDQPPELLIPDESDV
jgi:hypothetical protein